ncbi:outer membrane lipoprotein-sorting protein [Chthonomonas calidirosea]|uniref:Uncharacterized protein TP-0789 domain-containing protein n=1 Tax=Chthonomonas calidirosea (strain DSM 23976 / ICMP 18418 / T49) TaxID=1303518 RepID=S0EX95_CHTCT|nr:outer membrane lipoprotein-sorting protein [Chthonomonas calidirosea]CCW36077.1 hypothetical protein CCALI_02270 [Chthonomonas calidirosea T49]CEK17358.1 hypothetical protein CP488_01825 [Chthonomonas calidirosea]CEK18402.1 hypothetical protein CTKA_01825 [Chthonomonas calidirosea]
MPFAYDPARRAFLTSAIGLTVLSCYHPSQALADAISPDIQSYVVKDLQDFQAYIHLLRYNAEAGRRINKDFGLIYEWMQKAQGDLLVRYKEPDMFRLDGRFGAQSGVFIINGTTQIVRLSIGFKDVRDLGKSPGKRKTLLDMGLISPYYLSYTEAEFQGVRPFKGIPCAVFRISYRDKNLDTSFRLVWIDPKTHVTLKREEYSQEGKLLSIWYYKNIKKITSELYMPTEIEVDDNQGVLAGATTYRDIKVNIPMPDSLFK